MTRRAAPTGPTIPASGLRYPRISADIPTARNEPAVYRQTTARREPTPNPTGLPAYQYSGIVRTQYDVVQAAAIPEGPQRKQSRNMSPVTVHSTNPHVR